MIDTRVAAGIDVDPHVRELGHRVQHRMPNTFRDGVGLRQREITIGDDLHVGNDRVPQPAGAQVGDALDAFSVAGGLFSTFDHVRIDGVHEPLPDLTRRVLEYQQDRPGDCQADEWVRLRPPKPHPTRSDQHGQGREAIGPRVIPVGNQRGAADAVARADAVLGHQLVAREPEQPGQGDPAEIGDRFGMQQLLD